VDSSSTTSSTSAAAKPPVVVKADKPELTYEEQRLVSKGYKLNMRNGEKWFCRRELGLGSRVAAQNVCGTPSMLLPEPHGSAEGPQRRTEETCLPY
jgi:hypothetical protein